jgi:hypothetical protein
MTLLKLSGRITEAGKLEVDLPANLPAGEVRVTVEIPATEQAEVPWAQRPWTDEEWREMFQFTPKPLSEIVGSDVVGAWADQGIIDSVAWVEEVRRKERERRGW